MSYKKVSQKVSHRKSLKLNDLEKDIEKSLCNSLIRNKIRWDTFWDTLSRWFGGTYGKVSHMRHFFWGLFVNSLKIKSTQPLEPLVQPQASWIRGSDSSVQTYIIYNDFLLLSILVRLRSRNLLTFSPISRSQPFSTPFPPPEKRCQSAPPKSWSQLKVQRLVTKQSAPSRIHLSINDFHQFLSKKIQDACA